MLTIDTEFKKVIFQKDDFGIFLLKDGRAAKGSIIHPANSLLEVPITLSGNWVRNKYGVQFDFENYELLGGELYFFLTKILKGIPKKTAKEISQKIKNFNKLMNENPEKLKEFKGIGEVKYKRILEAWDKYKHLKELSEFLSPYNISVAYISKIYEYFKDGSVGIIRKNPYELTKIKGIGFKKADEVARKIGKPVDSVDRIEACIEYCLLNHMINEGHTIIEKENLKNITSEESHIKDEDRNIDFNLSDELFEKALNKLSIKERIRTIKNSEKIFITLSSYFYMENWIYNTLKKEKNSINLPLLEEKELENYIENIQKNMNMTFSKEQKEAIRIAADGQKIIAISGYAGCGKTTVSKAILKMFENKYGYDSIVCCALSGVAANRIKSATGYQSYTIHSLIKYGDENKMHKKDNPLPYKVVVLDEASMVDTEMFYRLMNAIDFNNTTFIMIGDNAQLPPVGAGAVYSNILEYNLAKNVMLTKIYRQNDDQAIVVFANEIREGKVPNNFLSNKYSDFTFIDKTPKNYWAIKKSCKTEREKKELREKINKSILEEITKICYSKRDEMIKLYNRNTAWEYISFLQVASPMKKGLLGVDNLNIIIQNTLNPKRKNGKEIQIGNYTYRVRDKILHLNNAFVETIALDEVKSHKEGNVEPSKTKIFNGQMGILIDIDLDEDILYVYYPFEKYVAIYYRDHFIRKDVGPGYAMSIHKLQGNEAKNFIMVTSWSHFIMLNAKLLYTGVTRAKEKIWIVGESGAFKKGCKTIDETKRLTLIKLLGEKNDN